MTPEEAQALIAGAGAADSAVRDELGPKPGVAGGALGEDLGGADDRIYESPGAHARSVQLVALEEENRALLEMALAAAAPMLPFLPQIYTAEVIASIAKAGAAVEQKYNVSISALFGRYKEEAMLAIAIVPPTVQAIMMTRVYIAQQKAAAASSSSAPPAPPRPPTSSNVAAPAAS